MCSCLRRERRQNHAVFRLSTIIWASLPGNLTEISWRPSGFRCLGLLPQLGALAVCLRKRRDSWITRWCFSYSPGSIQKLKAVGRSRSASMIPTARTSLPNLDFGRHVPGVRDGSQTATRKVEHYQPTSNSHAHCEPRLTDTLGTESSKYHYRAKIQPPKRVATNSALTLALHRPGSQTKTAYAASHSQTRFTPRARWSNSFSENAPTMSMYFRFPLRVTRHRLSR